MQTLMEKESVHITHQLSQSPNVHAPVVYDNASIYLLSSHCDNNFSLFNRL